MVWIINLILAPAPSVGLDGGDFILTRGDDAIEGVESEKKTTGFIGFFCDLRDESVGAYFHAALVPPVMTHILLFLFIFRYI